MNVLPPENVLTAVAFWRLKSDNARVFATPSMIYAAERAFDHHRAVVKASLTIIQGDRK